MSNDNPLGVPAHRHRNRDGTEGGGQHRGFPGSGFEGVQWGAPIMRDEDFARTYRPAPPPTPVDGDSGRRMETLLSRFAWLADSARSEGFHEAAAAYTVCRDELSDAPTPAPASPPVGGGRAPSPFETFQAGMAAGLLSDRHALIHDYTEAEVREEFRDWLEERAAAAAADRGEGRPPVAHHPLDRLDELPMTSTPTPEPGERDPALAAELNEKLRQSYNAETMRTRPAPSAPTPDGRPNPGCRMSTIDGDLFVSLDDLYRFMEWVIEVSGPDGEILFGGALRLIRENFADATPAPAHPGGERPAGEWTAVDLLADLNDRAERAMVELEKRASRRAVGSERTRLLGKLSGLALVADWLRSYTPPTPVEEA